MCTRAAGVSPPWFGNRVCKCHAMTFRVSRSHADCTPRGADASRSWLHARHIACDVRFRFAAADVSHGGLHHPLLVHCMASVDRKNNAFCDAQTHAPKSGGRQPAVGIANAGAVALVCHGQLTLTALVLRCERFPAKKRFLRCTNARSQERRALARRGSVIASATAMR
jgi:hypothetical protein